MIAFRHSPNFEWTKPPDAQQVPVSGCHGLDNYTVSKIDQVI